MRFVILVFLYASILLPASGQRVPFGLPYDGSAPVAIANATPAGRDGFVHVAGAHFVDGSGQRIKFLGVNGSFSGNFPPKEQAAGIAARLAAFGFNCFRHHHMDSSRAPRGLISAAYSDTQHLDPDTLDRLDYFIYQLKQHGVYSNINLHVGRTLNAADGFPDSDARPNYDKGIGMVHPGMIAMQKSYAHDLLTHVNPYTGVAYVDEPSVAIVEISNEDGMVRGWGNGSLDDLPAVYWQALVDRWNIFLRERYGSTAALAVAWQPGNATDGPELSDATFSRWWTQVIAPGAATTEVLPTGGPSGEPVLHVTVTNADPTGWHVQSMDRPSATTQGDRMIARVWARAEPARTARLSVSMDHDPWSGNGLSRSISLTPDWQEFEVGFTALYTDSRIRFTVGDLALAAGEVWVVSPSLRVVAPVALPAGETLEATAVAALTTTAYAIRSATCRADWTEFIVGVEESYFAEMLDYLKSDLGVQCPITGTQMGFGVVTAELPMDFIDAHSYWHHPSFPGTPWSSTDWYVINESIQNPLANSSITSLARRRPYGKPYTVTEYNHPAPNTYSAEAFLMLAAYGALQDWDGLFVYSYSHGDYENRSMDSFFDLVGHTPKMLTMPAAAAIFRRADVAPAEVERRVSISRDALLARMVDRPGDISVHGTDVLGLAGHEALVHRIGTELLSTPGIVEVTAETLPVPTSAEADTGEILWSGAGEGRACTLIRAPKSKAMVGFIGPGPFDLGDGFSVLSASGEEEWVCFTLTEIESGGPDAARWLATLSGYAENTGMVWKDVTHTSCGNQWGSGPPLVEVPDVELALPWEPARVAVRTLDEAGQPGSQVPVLLGTEPGTSRLLLDGGFGSPWFLIEAQSAQVPRSISGQRGASGPQRSSGRR